MAKILRKDYITTMEKVLITGSKGFTAKNLETCLNQQNMKPYFLDRTQNADNTNYILKNGTKEIQKVFSIQELYTFGFSGVFHLATTYRHTYDDNDFNSLVEANINLTYQLSKLCSKNEIPLILPGSYFQDHYQESAGNSSIYATIKNSGEAILSFMSLTSELNYAVTRQFESYGEFDHRNKLLNRIIDCSILETEVDLPATDLYLDYLNISDICAAYLAIFNTLKKSRGSRIQKFEISSGDSLKLSQVIKLIEKEMAKKIRIAKHREDRAETIVSKFEYSKDWPIGWEPTTTLESDLQHLIANRELMIQTEKSNR